MGAGAPRVRHVSLTGCITVHRVHHCSLGMSCASQGPCAWKPVHTGCVMCHSQGASLFTGCITVHWVSYCSLVVSRVAPVYMRAPPRAREYEAPCRLAESGITRRVHHAAPGHALCPVYMRACQGSVHTVVSRHSNVTSCKPSKWVRPQSSFIQETLGASCVFAPGASRMETWVHRAHRA